MVLLPDNPPNTDVLLDDTVGAGLAVEPAGVVPNMGLKLWTECLLSGVEVVEEVVGVTAKMGLNPAASRGLLLLTGAAAATVLGAEEALGVPACIPAPNRPAAPAAAGVLLVVVET